MTIPESKFAGDLTGKIITVRGFKLVFAEEGVKAIDVDLTKTLQGAAQIVEDGKKAKVNYDDAWVAIEGPFIDGVVVHPLDNLLEEGSKIVMRVRINGLVGADLDGSTLDAEPVEFRGILHFTDGTPQLQTGGEVADAVAKIFQNAYVGEISLIEKAREKSVELHEGTEVHYIPSWQRFVPRHEWTPKLGKLSELERDGTKLKLVLCVTLLDPSGNLFCHESSENFRSVFLSDFDYHEILAFDGGTPGEAFDEHLAEELQRLVLAQVGYAVPREDARRAVLESFPIYTPVNVSDARHIGLSMTVSVPSPQALTKIELKKPIWMAREYANLQMHVASMLRPDALAWSFAEWTKIYLQFTVTPEVRKYHLQSLAQLQFLFFRQRQILDNLQALIPRDPSKPNNPQFQQRIERGTTMEVLFPNDGEDPSWQTFTVPLSGLVDKFHVTWSDDEPPLVKEFEFGSSIQGQAVKSTDLQNWQEHDLSVMLEREKGDSPIVDAVSEAVAAAQPLSDEPQPGYPAAS